VHYVPAIIFTVAAVAFLAFYMSLVRKSMRAQTTALSQSLEIVTSMRRLVELQEQANTMLGQIANARRDA
jgi:hypothetical protein